MHTDLGAHFCEPTDENLGTAVTGVAHILAVGGAQHQHIGRGNGDIHITHSIAGNRCGMQSAPVIDIDGLGCDLENIIFKSENVLTGSHAQSAVLGQAITADSCDVKGHKVKSEFENVKSWTVYSLNN